MSFLTNAKSAEATKNKPVRLVISDIQCSPTGAHLMGCPVTFVNCLAAGACEIWPEDLSLAKYYFHSIGSLGALLPRPAGLLLQPADQARGNCQGLSETTLAHSGRLGRRNGAVPSHPARPLIRNMS